jgi:hypothetical protein
MGDTDFVPVDRQYLGTLFLFHATRLHLTVHQKLFTYDLLRRYECGRSIYVPMVAQRLAASPGPSGDESIMPLFHRCKFF